jgi:hypothetical protein
MKPRIIIRMGAAHWDARVRHNDQVIMFDFRSMTGKQRSQFHRELMNGVRQVIAPRATAAA